MLKRIISPVKLIDYLRNNPRRLVFAFHRVSKEKNTQENPFNLLSNVPPFQFEMLIRFFKSIATFSDLENFFSVNGERKFRSYVHFTFDDVSTSFVENALPIIEKHQIPVSIFPSGKNAEEGFSWRDKIYYIQGNSQLLSLFVSKASLSFGKNVDINEKNMYSWSKNPELNQRLLENQVIDQVMEKHKKDFCEKVKKYCPYLNWEELRKISAHPLVTIGNHGFNHYDFRSVSEEEIQDDITKSHKLIEKNTGIKCKHFAIPFGEISQKSFLTIDRILTELDYQTAGWSKRANNPRMQYIKLKHYFRIDSVSNNFVNFVKFCKASIKTRYFPLSGIPFSSYQDPGKKIDFVNNVILEEYKTFFRRIHPQKLHHQNDEYINHLYYENPFRENNPLHFAIKGDNDVFSIGSLFYIPFLLKGEKHLGSYFCGWFRLPEFPSESLRAQKIFEEAQKASRLIGAYHPSSNSLNFYKNWDRVKIYRLTLKKRRKTKAVQNNLEWSLSNKWDPRLQKIIDVSHKNLSISIQRGPELYKWRIERYPLCRFFYFYPKDVNPEWFIIFCKHRNTLYISDFCLTSLQESKLISEMFLHLVSYCSKEEIHEVILETSNKLVLEIAKKNRFKVAETFFNVYRYPSARGEEIFWKKVHETQISGDILPRLNISL